MSTRSIKGDAAASTILSKRRWRSGELDEFRAPGLRGDGENSTLHHEDVSCRGSRESCREWVDGSRRNLGKCAYDRCAYTRGYDGACANVDDRYIPSRSPRSRRWRSYLPRGVQTEQKYRLEFSSFAYEARLSIRLRVRLKGRST